MRPAIDLLLLTSLVVLFLGPIQLFLTYRFRRALRRGKDRAYLPHADPWLPPVLLLTGAALVALLRLLR